MTQPRDSSSNPDQGGGPDQDGGPAPAVELGRGTDVEVRPADLTTDERPASSDPEEFVDADRELGGMGGDQAGGAG